MRTLAMATIIIMSAAISGCLPIMFDRDWNWRGTEPSRPAFGSMIDAGIDAEAGDDTGDEMLDEEMVEDDDDAVDNETLVDGGPAE